MLVSSSSSIQPLTEEFSVSEDRPMAVKSMVGLSKVSAGLGTNE